MADMTLGEATKLAEKLFGERYNVFTQEGLFYVGRFLDDGRRQLEDGTIQELAPYHRDEEIFGCGRSLREAFRFATGDGVTYSISGIAPGGGARAGHKPVYNKYGQLRGWESPAGIFSRHFPGSLN